MRWHEPTIAHVVARATGVARGIATRNGAIEVYNDGPEISEVIMIAPRHAAFLAAALASSLATLGCEHSTRSGGAATTEPNASTTIAVTSPAFGQGQPIPAKFTEDGQDVSPELRWSGLPAKTRQIALIMDDPDAPSADPWVHWVIYAIPASTTSLPEGVARDETPNVPAGARQGKNSWGTVGYRGPAPPAGKVHHYHFTVYAIDTELSSAPGLDKAALLSQIEGHVLAKGELVGTYRR